MSLQVNNIIPKLNGKNYFSWCVDIKFLLIERNAWRLVIGEETAPKSGEDSKDFKKLEEFEARARTALTTIYLNISEDYRKIIECCETAPEAWVKLKNYFSPDNRSRHMTLFSELCNCKLKTNENIELFAARINGIQTQLKGIGKAIDEEYLAYQLLRYLPSEFDGIVQTIMRWDNAKFKYEEIVNELVAEESRLKLRNADKIQNAEVMQTFRLRKPNITCFRCGLKGHVKSNCRVKISHEKGKNRNTKFNPSLKNRDEKKDFQIGKAGTFLTQAYFSKTSENGSDWIFDTAASNHFCNDKTFFIEFVPVCDENLVVAIKDVSLPIEGKGTVKMDFGYGIVTFSNVLYSPKLRKNLIAGSKCDLGGATFKGEKGKIIISKGRRTYFTATLHNNIYYVFPKRILKTETINEANVVTKDISKDWHRKLAHISPSLILKTSQNRCVRGLPNFRKINVDCEHCQVNKFKRVSFKLINKVRSNRPLELIYMDVWGPTSEIGRRGERFFLLIIDDFSRKSSIYPIQSKSDVFNVFRNHVTRAERFLGTKLKAIRTDNGREFVNENFEVYCRKYGVKHELTNVYSPEENGVVERYNQTVTAGIRTLLSESNLPKSFWTEAGLYFCYTQNRVCHSNQIKTPFELYGGKIPSVRHLKPFGVEVYLGIPRQLRSKFDARATKGIFVGYALRTRGYRVYLPEEDKIVESINVKFSKTSDSGAVMGQNKNTQPNENGESFNFRIPDQQPCTSEDESEEEPDLERTDESDSEPEQEPISLKEAIWIRKPVPRKKSSRIDIFYYEQGCSQRLRSLNDVEKYCAEKGLIYEPNLFSFRGSDPFSGIINPSEDPSASSTS